MTEAPVLPTLLERREHQLPAPGRARPRPPTVCNSESARAIQIVAPDQHCTTLLMEYASPLFRPQIVSGSAWIVRLQPPAGEGWVLELLALVERWLESAGIPCAKLVYDDRTYLIRASTRGAPFAAAEWMRAQAVAWGRSILRPDNLKGMEAI